jgi:hypothetical protein
MKFTNIAAVGNLEFNDLGMVVKGSAPQSRYITLLPGESVYLPDGQDVMYSAQRGDAYRFQRAGLLAINDIFVLTANAGITPTASIAHGYGFVPNVVVAQFNNAANVTGGVTTIQSNSGTFSAGSSITVYLYVNQTTIAFPTPDPTPTITPAVTVTQAYAGGSLAGTLTPLAAALQVALRAYITATVGTDVTSTVTSSGTGLVITPKKGTAVLGNVVQAVVSWVSGDVTDTCTFCVIGPWTTLAIGAVLNISTDQALMTTAITNLSAAAVTWMVRIS